MAEHCISTSCSFLCKHSGFNSCWTSACLESKHAGRGFCTCIDCVPQPTINGQLHASLSCYWIEFRCPAGIVSGFTADATVWHAPWCSAARTTSWPTNVLPEISGFGSILSESNHACYLQQLWSANAILKFLEVHCSSLM